MIVCNFIKFFLGQFVLFSVDEVGILFYEFGYVFYNLFKDVYFYVVFGVLCDFVELFFQVMEYWVFELEVLKIYVKYYWIGEVIFVVLIEKFDKSGKYGQGFVIIEYFVVFLFDMDYYVLKEIFWNMDVIEFEVVVLKECGLLSQIFFCYCIIYFNYIMNSGYMVGYYSYIWVEVLDSDVFEVYKEIGDLFNQEVVFCFCCYIFIFGGIDDVMDMYKNFWGKELGIEFLLRNRGLQIGLYKVLVLCCWVRGQFFFYFLLKINVENIKNINSSQYICGSLQE